MERRVVACMLGIAVVTTMAATPAPAATVATGKIAVAFGASNSGPEQLAFIADGCKTNRKEGTLQALIDISALSASNKTLTLRVDGPETRTESGSAQPGLIGLSAGLTCTPDSVTKMKRYTSVTQGATFSFKAEGKYLVLYNNKNSHINEKYTLLSN